MSILRRPAPDPKPSRIGGVHPDVPRVPSMATAATVRGQWRERYPNPIPAVDAMDVVSRSRTGKPFRRNARQRMCVIGGDGNTYDASTGKRVSEYDGQSGGLSESIARLAVLDLVRDGILRWHGAPHSPETSTVSVWTDEELAAAADEARQQRERSREAQRQFEDVAVTLPNGQTAMVKRSQASAIESEAKAARRAELEAMLRELQD